MIQYRYKFLEKNLWGVYFNCILFDKWNDISLSFLSVCQAVISAFLPRFFVMAGRGFILVWLWFCLSSQRRWCASAHPPPTGLMWPTFIAGTETQCLRQPIGSGRFAAKRSATEPPQTTGFHRLHNRPRSLILYNYLIHLLCNLNHLFNFSYTPLSYRCTHVQLDNA